MDYWVEAVESSLEEHGVKATTEQIECIAGDIEVCHENYGMAHGHDVIYSNWVGSQESEIARLKKLLREEKDKTPCRTCNGRGFVVSPGPYHSSEHQCWTCHGAGRI